MTAIRTLIVDDDFAVARLHTSFLQRMPEFDPVGSALTASSALGMLREGDVDLVLLDLYLPAASGIDLLRWIRADASITVDVIVVSAAAEPHIVRQAMALGVTDFLMKPFSYDELKERLGAYVVKVRARNRLEHIDRLTQTQIDLLRGDRSAATRGDTSKGANPLTRDRVLSSMAAQQSAVTAAELAEVTGLSRVSTRRYLERLVDEGLVDMQPRYGDAGRPQHEYRLKTASD